MRCTYYSYAARRNNGIFQTLEMHTMTLWTIQPEKLYHSILKTGKCICDPLQFNMPEFVEMYNWLVLQMKKRIGDPPEGVIYPVWAWHTQRSKRHKPDLRSERWANGYDGEKFVCLEIEVPDEQVLLSDFDLWSLILLDSIITETEEEDHKLTEIYKGLTPQKQLEMKYKNWNRVFDVTPFENEWTRRGSWIQATFWVLTKDMIKKVRHFKAAKHCEQPVEK